MRTLVVLTQPPLPEGGAPGKCAVALLRGLAEHGVDVAALAARRHFAVAGDPPDDLPVTTVAVTPERPTWRARLRRLRRPLGDLAHGEFGERVRAAARHADVLHLEEIETAWCDEGTGVPATAHIHFILRLDRRLGAPWSARFRYGVESTLAERAAARRHPYLVASSPRIAGHLRKLAPRAEIVHAPLSLDPRYYRPAPLDGPPTAGVIGTAAWPPTAAALESLVAAMWPDVRARVPEARLLVAGRGTQSLGLEGAGVEVLGEVPSAVEFLRGLSVLLYPIERGSGVKVKVLEAIASGVPVVTTPDGAEGLDAGDGLVVTTRERAFVDAAVALLTDAGARRQRGDAARGAFLQRYSPRPATEPLVDLYRRMVD